jgi:hypothetical protein
VGKHRVDVILEGMIHLEYSALFFINAKAAIFLLWDILIGANPATRL